MAPFNPNITLDELRKLHEDFIKERKWEQYHTPRNVTLALVGEIGELAEIFQWKSDEMCKDVQEQFTDKEKENLQDELSDCLFYLLRLSDLCGVNLPEVAFEKMKKNALKYPIGKSLGRSDKYTTYQQQDSDEKKIESSSEEVSKQE